MKDGVFYQVSTNQNVNHQSFMTELVDGHLMEWYMELSHESNEAPVIETLVSMVLSELKNAAFDSLVELEIGKSANTWNKADVDYFIELKSRDCANQLLSKVGLTELLDEDEIVSLILSRIDRYGLFLLDGSNREVLNEPKGWDVW